MAGVQTRWPAAPERGGLPHRATLPHCHTVTQDHRATHRATVLPQYLQISNFSHKVSECVTAAATVSRKAKDTFYTKYAEEGLNH